MRLALLVLLAGCSVHHTFTCAQDDQCRLGTNRGTCLAGSCAFPDMHCTSGLRYDETAPDGLASQCVGAMIDAGAGSDAPSMPPDASPTFQFRMNLGGPTYTGVDHPGTWLADDHMTCPEPTFSRVNTSINGTVDDTLFWTGIHGDMLNCTLHGLAPGAYQVTLLFAETVYGCPQKEGQKRMTSVLVQGQLVGAPFEVFGEAGCATTTGKPDRKVYAATVTDGNLAIEVDGSPEAELPAVQVVSAF